jgi:uncharacterized protein YodC (DUF2158 family)
MSEQEFKLGDVVQHKTGGSAMTVIGISEDGKTIQCEWIDKREERKSDSFSIESLKPFESNTARLSGYFGPKRDTSNREW